MDIACKLTSPELAHRKATVIQSLKSKVTERREKENGFQLKLDASDENIDQVTDFIKLERICCDFLSFELRVEGENLLLTMTGPEGAKKFIEKEMEL